MKLLQLFCIYLFKYHNMFFSGIEYIRPLVYINLLVNTKKEVLKITEHMVGTVSPFLTIFIGSFLCCRSICIVRLDRSKRIIYFQFSIF